MVERWRIVRCSVQINTNTYANTNTNTNTYTNTYTYTNANPITDLGVPAYLNLRRSVRA